ncbi:oligosaccharide flippase family protein [Chryseobacterium sp. SNU WT5]|uniref:oligosaccharide flippase family protein n=1 Tax=Chryseobacterium sp. SNU WT5 TaxID=2594269 RepID=UPI00117E94D2|nr:oligosaccharide flippase family protein [Chryseobacterium sp. SNU WT5]QDP85076.1 oligosaccharide flippase family protein [Chryseobacterium sp. SNU WT5]
MKSLRNFIIDFIKNKGQHVFLSLLIAKICAFAGSLFIIRILPENQFGTISIVASLFAMFLPFSGFGSQQSLLRFGSISNTISEKRNLSRYLFKQGLVHQILLSIIFMVISLFYVDRYEEIFLIFIFFTVRLIGFYFFNHLQSESRVFGDNKRYSFLTNVVNVIGLFLLVLLSYLFGLKGYLIAIALTPFISLFFFRSNHLSSTVGKISFSKLEIRKYGLHAAGTALLSDTLFSVDVLMLSFMMSEAAVANYKVAILIPTNITFLALTFMQSDFPVLAKNYQNKSFLRNYISNYYKIFIPITLLVFIFGFVFKSELLNIFFGKRYSENIIVFIILLAGFCTNMLFRNLYGNLLSAVGKMKINTIISMLTLAILFFSAFLLINKFGVVGMAISLSLSMILGGFLLSFSFYLYWKDLK